MNRLTKELKKAGIIYEADDYAIIMKGVEYDNDQKLVGIFGDVIVTIWSSAVMDPEFRLYDRRTFAPIGSQDMFPYTTFSGSRSWGSFVYMDEEVA